MALPIEPVRIRSKEEKVTKIIEREEDCPVCGTPCEVVITQTTQGNMGGGTAEYTPLPNTNT